MDYLYIVISLAFILLSAELFTNSIEWLGVRLRLSQGAVGSVLAAVGTALPETMVPIMALLSNNNGHGTAIGVGAILGAPFMLGTLAFLITGLAALYYSKRSRRSAQIKVNQSVIRRDLGFFLSIYTLAIATAFLPFRSWKLIVAAALFLGYLFYVYLTFKGEGEAEHSVEGEIKPLFLARSHPEPSYLRIILQLLASLGIMVTAAHAFVGSLEGLAIRLNASPFLLSVIITPIATELPEKFNSVLWMSQGKDTLALGNITGAMVFQSSVIPAIGILLTPWTLHPEELLTAVLAILSSAVLYRVVRTRKVFSPKFLLSGGLFYVMYLLIVSTGVVDTLK